ncbi:MAG TPA: hypothetical protein VGM30_10265 [Puia sp.]|jgi:hypothetical protein
MSKVIVTANELGLVVVASTNNPDYGYIRVQQTSQEFINGWLQPRTKSALIRGRVADLQELGYTLGRPLEGKIVIKETLTAPNPLNPMQDMKMAGDSGITCTLDDQPIYRTAFYTTNMEDTDVLIAHNNTEAIRAAQKAKKELAGTATL